MMGQSLSLVRLLFSGATNHANEPKLWDSMNPPSDTWMGDL